MNFESQIRIRRMRILTSFVISLVLRQTAVFSLNMPVVVCLAYLYTIHVFVIS